MHTQVVDLNETLERMREPLEAVLGADVALGTALDEDLGAVNADPALLEQTIVNLVLNARDAMPRGGALRISTRNVVVDASLPDAPQLVPGGYSKITLEDTGSGMDAETLARVFEPFFSTKTDARGTGLGLPTAYGFVKQSGGEITITSAPGEGTAVRIYLPHAAEIVVTPVSPAERPRVPSAVETVLLVEDDHNARTLVGRILRESGYDVHEAALPSEALSFSEQYERQIHLLVSDVVMPEMSGPSVAKRILEMRPDTRVLFVSGYIDSADDVDIVSSGAAFLQKPFTPTELLSAVRRVLDDREAVPA
jgi:CheY-like chemotaxis protein